jgi:hypothetical protein
MVVGKARCPLNVYVLNDMVNGRSSKGSNRVVQSSHLLATYHVTYFTTYLIRRTRRRVISDLNSDNELR